MTTAPGHKGEREIASGAGKKTKNTGDRAIYTNKYNIVAESGLFVHNVWRLLCDCLRFRLDKYNNYIFVLRTQEWKENQKNTLNRSHMNRSCRYSAEKTRVNPLEFFSQLYSNCGWWGSTSVSVSTCYLLFSDFKFAEMASFKFEWTPKMFFFFKVSLINTSKLITFTNYWLKLAFVEVISLTSQLSPDWNVLTFLMIYQ